MMSVRTVARFAVLLVAWLAAATPAAAQPYAGQQSRLIKALSPEEITGYLTGAGMGLAKPAELNHHPGPKHVLELADQLQLTPEQREATQHSYDLMHVRATALGRQIVVCEAALDSAFAAGGVDPAQLEQRLQQIAALQGQLRTAHLRAHLDMRALLSAEQIARYDELRGYSAAPAPAAP